MNKAILHGLGCEQGKLGHKKATTRPVEKAIWGACRAILEKYQFRVFFDYIQLCTGKVELLILIVL